ncbi:2-oxo-4-hydroxy-4-carboxy-5-ureidoimidazoline decarboxylase [Streptomyces uncialis]|uniref:2-oxo-4-hydroxy-4-carboxy-5-ureidoimidazoline decarboxylase n=1 Tax=Streptomyces uncialis TaxID=1048205 RepID=A0A1Q4V6T2_9ACTN|nr:2-oxo-4-hydroxy-4-carboxy-5-ureidoimidazoline decarboxylase [Streptomyces uncialis]MCX4659311.1 2-oxo-4-hydroxy-4-carboxy-5-ureidoimidazoline decarboxylase [Streptomyces uncialis]OKH93552.1 OHCU decarboxylase [Streptomyces uncialis]WST67418.1 2-oxo-4-hydroxy-4-carboxy-5-ureidoimidazoline decarboxylase [Streptomyces uncialis]
MTSSASAGSARFNALSRDAATAELRAVCASAAWIDGLLARRPYLSDGELLAAADTVTAGLEPADLAEALAAHPPIGRPEPGASAREQRGMAGASAELRADLLDLNLAYQERFGHVFLICATGRTAGEMRDAARERLGNTPERERETVRTELGRINRVRLIRLLEGEHT